MDVNSQSMPDGKIIIRLFLHVEMMVFYSFSLGKWE